MARCTLVRRVKSLSRTEPQNQPSILSWLQGIPSFIQYPSETTGFVQTAGEAGLIVQQKLSEDDQDVPNVGEVGGLLDVGHADGRHIEVQDGQIDNKAVCEDGLVMEQEVQQADRDNAVYASEYC